MLTREQAQAITRLAHLLRPSWNQEGIFAALGRVKDRDGFEVALATIRAAADPNVKTPGVIPSPGPHWNEAPPEPKPVETYRPPRKTEDCPRHPGNYADACRGCAADERAGDTTAPGEPRKPDRSAHIDRLRAELAAVQVRLCGHGVDRSRGKCAECESSKPERQEEVSA